MASAEKKYLEPRKPLSLVPGAAAEWVKDYNDLLDDLEKGKYRTHETLHVYGSKPSNNGLIQDLLQIALNKVKRSEDSIEIKPTGLPNELITFLKSPAGQTIVTNMLMSWFQNGMGMNNQNKLVSSEASPSTYAEQSKVIYSEPINSPVFEASHLEIPVTEKYDKVEAETHQPIVVNTIEEPPPTNPVYVQTNASNALSRAEKLRERARMGKP